MIHPCVPVPAFETLDINQQPKQYEVGIKLSAYNGLYSLLFIYILTSLGTKQILFFFIFQDNDYCKKKVEHYKWSNDYIQWQQLKYLIS